MPFDKVADRGIVEAPKSDGMTPNYDVDIFFLKWTLPVREEAMPSKASGRLSKMEKGTSFERGFLGLFLRLISELGFS